MGTRHWPEDADREVERLERRIEELEAQQKEACELVSAWSEKCDKLQQQNKMIDDLADQVAKLDDQLDIEQRKYEALLEKLEEHIESWDTHSATPDERGVVDSFRAIIEQEVKDDETN